MLSNSYPIKRLSRPDLASQESFASVAFAWTNPGSVSGVSDLIPQGPMIPHAACLTFWHPYSRFSDLTLSHLRLPFLGSYIWSRPLVVVAWKVPTVLGTASTILGDNKLERPSVLASDYHPGLGLAGLLQASLQRWSVYPLASPLPNVVLLRPMRHQFPSLVVRVEAHLNYNCTVCIHVQ